MHPGEPERRSAERFAVNLPVAVRATDGSFEPETALTRDLSAKGIFFFMSASPKEGARIEFTVTLPPEVTLTDPMRVNARGRVVRVLAGQSGRQVGVAATIDGYNSFIRLSRSL
ncbi:MAG TPA: PilZ domain-containing protein [Terriglobales bacterium]|jgi:hypothetical protein|nr:PilZ domain-containing protein [Terriglobales bacterium]